MYERISSIFSSNMEDLEYFLAIWRIYGIS